MIEFFVVFLLAYLVADLVAFLTFADPAAPYKLWFIALPGSGLYLAYKYSF